MREMFSRILSGFAAIAVLTFFAFTLGFIFHIFYKAYQMGWRLL